MHPHEALFLRSFLLPQLQSEQSVTAKIIRAVPPGQDAFQPNPKAKSAFGLAWHIAVCEIWIFDGVLHRQFGETADRPEAVTTCAHVADWYDANFAERIPFLESLSSEDLITRVEFNGLRNDPAVAYLGIAMRHAIHHRGQLSTYLRAMDAHVPAIYVESADEPWPPAPASPAAATGQSPPAF